MAEDGVPAAKSGYKLLGERSDGTQKTRDTAIRGILKTWNLTDFDQVIPAAIKPKKDMGNSAIVNIRSISLRTSLAEAQVMFLAECKDSTGAPIPMTFGHTARVAKDLLAAEAATKAAQDGGEEASNTAINTKPKRRSKAAETTEKIVGLSVPKVTHDLVAPSKGLAPPFTFGSSPSSKNANGNQPTKPNTRGVAMKAVLGGSQSTKSAARVSAFAFLEAQSSPTTGILVKKRPAPSEAAEDKEKLEERIVFKKARKEDNLVSKSGGALFNPFDDLNKLIYEPVEAVNESLHKAIKPPSEVIRNPDEALNEPIRKVFGNSSEVIPRPVEAPSHSSSEDAMAILERIMTSEKAENDKFFGSKLPKLVSYTAFNRGEHEKLFNSNTPKLPPVVVNESESPFKANNPMLASAMLEENNADEDTIVVDVEGARSKSLDPIQTSQIKRATRSLSPVKVTARKGPINREQRKAKVQDFNIHPDSNVEVGPKTTVVAPVADVAQMLSGGAPTAPMNGNQQSEPASAVDQATSLQSTARQAIALQTSGIQGGRFKEHCDFISSGLRDVLDTQRLFDLAHPDQLPLALDLQVVFDTAIRHLEGDLAYVFKKHGADI